MRCQKKGGRRSKQEPGFRLYNPARKSGIPNRAKKRHDLARAVQREGKSVVQSIRHKRKKRLVSLRHKMAKEQKQQRKTARTK